MNFVYCQISNRVFWNFAFKQINIMYITCKINFVKGLPSQMQLVRTHQSRPSAAPQIQEAAMVNSSTAFISWSPVQDEHHNGPLTGYQVRFSTTHSCILLYWTWCAINILLDKLIKYNVKSGYKYISNKRKLLLTIHWAFSAPKLLVLHLLLSILISQQYL